MDDLGITRLGGRVGSVMARLAFLLIPLLKVSVVIVVFCRGRSGLLQLTTLVAVFGNPLRRTSARHLSLEESGNDCGRLHHHGGTLSNTRTRESSELRLVVGRLLLLPVLLLLLLLLFLRGGAAGIGKLRSDELVNLGIGPFETFLVDIDTLLLLLVPPPSLLLLSDKLLLLVRGGPRSSPPRSPTCLSPRPFLQEGGLWCGWPSLFS